MGRVFVAGSINMDVVATAERHPRIGETVAGHAVLYFPGGKGANQAVAAAKLGAPTTLIGCVGKDAFGEELKTFLAAQGIDLSFGAGNGRSPHRNGDHHASPMPTTPSSSFPAPMRWSVPPMSARPALAKGDIAVSQFEIPLPAITRLLQARPRGGSDDDPQSGAGTRMRPRTARSRRYSDPQRKRTRSAGADSSFATPMITHASSEAMRSLHTAQGQIICVTLGSRGAVRCSRQSI